MKKAILGLLFVGMGWSQSTGSNVVNVIVLSPTVVNGTHTYTSSPLQNIGQTSHQLTLVLSNMTTAVTLSGSIQGSWDNTNWFALGPNYFNVALTGNGIVNLSGYKSYPYLRTTFTINPMASTPTIAAYYAGNSAPTQNLVDQLGSIVQMVTEETVMHDGPNLGVATLLAPGASQQSTVYGVIVNVPSTATLLQLGCSDAGAIFNNVLIDSNSGLGGTLILQNGIRPWIQCAIGSRLYYKLTGTGDGELILIYRNE